MKRPVQRLRGIRDSSVRFLADLLPSARNGQPRRHTILREKWAESLKSVLPVTLVILVLCFLVVPLPSDSLLAFVFGSILLIAGIGIFNLGTEMSMTPIGESVGSALTRSRNLPLILAVSFLVGVMVTLAEPDLTVLAAQVAGVPDLTLILCVALGVGFFLMLGMLRILYQIQMRFLLLICYGVVLLLSTQVPASFLAVAFDSGGVTTGPMTVPFILSLGLGVASIRSDSKAESDSFGLVALASIGPVLAVMILGMIFHPEESGSASIRIVQAPDTMKLFDAFLGELPDYLKEVGLALLPILLFFVVFQVTSLHIRGALLRRILLGLVYTYTGLVLFLLGANVGFMPVGYALGQQLGSLDIRWIMVPVGMIIGWYVVSAEPAVQILCHQVYSMTAGAIPPRALSLSLSAGVSLSVGLAILRILTGTPIMAFLIPGYCLALILTFFVPPVFTSIAFDSGGVASGPMTATFLLPFAMGACNALGGNLATDAFGVVAMVAMTPLIAIQSLGLVYRLLQRKDASTEEMIEEEIIDL